MPIIESLRLPWWRAAAQSDGSEWSCNMRTSQEECACRREHSWSSPSVNRHEGASADSQAPRGPRASHHRPPPWTERL